MAFNRCKTVSPKNGWRCMLRKDHKGIKHKAATRGPVGGKPRIEEWGHGKSNVPIKRTVNGTVKRKQKPKAKIDHRPDIDTLSEVELEYVIELIADARQEFNGMGGAEVAHVEYMLVEAKLRKQLLQLKGMWE